MKQGTYLYQPLRQDEPHIRLLRVLPAAPNSDDVHISLLVTSLAKSPQFDAVSYAWGTSDITDAIICEGKTMEIRPRVREILSTARDRPDISWLWLDAIAINQLDIQEKGHTVSNMPIIYAAAARTLCWIDTLTLHRPSLDIILNSVRNVAIAEQISNACLSTTDLYHSTHKIEPHDLDALLEMESTIADGAWNELSAFLDDGYFGRYDAHETASRCLLTLCFRLWITQDIVCSKEPVIFDSGNNLAWTQLVEAVLIWTLLCPNPKIISASVKMLLSTEAMRRKWHGLSQTQLTLPEILLALRSCRLPVSDQRDHVFVGYSIAGTLYPSGAIHSPDYSITLEQSLIRASIDVNKLSKQPLSLSLVNAVQKNASWSPDWRFPSVRFLLNYPSSNFSASAFTMNEDNWRTKESGLFTMGVLLDSIKETSEYLPPRR